VRETNDGIIDPTPETQRNVSTDRWIDDSDSPTLSHHQRNPSNSDHYPD
jgi:hypothetical protein